MNKDITMSVSSMTRNKDKKAIYVLFRDGEKTAEYCVPGCELVRNNGFSDEEIKSLKEYVENEQETIFAMAKEVNPLKAIMGT